MYKSFYCRLLYEKSAGNQKEQIKDKGVLVNGKETEDTVKRT